jgi:hypothetical protein
MPLRLELSDPNVYEYEPASETSAGASETDRICRCRGPGFAADGKCTVQRSRKGRTLDNTVQGSLAHKKTPTPLDHHRPLGIGLL